MHWDEMTADIRGAIVIVKLRGTMCLCGEDKLPMYVEALIEEGHRKFLLDLSAVPYIDSGGLAEVVRSLVVARRCSGRLGLLHIAHRIRVLLEVTRLAPHLEVFECEEDAVLRFSEPIAVRP